MGKLGNRSGGGIEGRQVGHYRDRKSEPVTYPIDPGRAADIGMSVHYRKMPLQGEGYSNPIGPSDNMGQGPGANRTIMRSGTQASTPAPRPMPHGRKTF
jgi:hypothetical protein